MRVLAGWSVNSFYVSSKKLCENRQAREKVDSATSGQKVVVRIQSQILDFSMETSIRKNFIRYSFFLNAFSQLLCVANSTIRA